MNWIVKGDYIQDYLTGRLELVVHFLVVGFVVEIHYTVWGHHKYLHVPLDLFDSKASFGHRSIG